MIFSEVKIFSTATLLYSFVRWLLVFFTFSVFSQSFANEYSVSDRYRLLEDKMLVNDFIHLENVKKGFRLNFSLTTGAVSQITDLDDLSSENYQDYISSNLNKEQNAFLSFNVLLPFKKIRLTEFELTPHFFWNYQFGFVSTIYAKILTKADFDNFVLTSLSNPDDRKIVREILANISNIPSEGENVFGHLIDEGGCSTSDLLLFCEEKRDQSNPLLMPSNDEEKLFLYSKSQMKTGLLFEFDIVNNWKGFFSVYSMLRGDNIFVLDQQTALNDNFSVINEVFSPDNTQHFTMIDVKFQVRLRPFLVHFQMQELKITRLSDDIDNSGDLVYTNDPLYHLNIYYTYNYSDYKISPFLGFHRRRGYSTSDGYLMGVDLDNLKSKARLRLMLDPEFFSFFPQFRLGALDVSYRLQLPIGSELEENINQQTIHSLSLSYPL